MEFEAWLNQTVTMIERYLKQRLTPEECRQKTVLDAMAYSVGAGGKRIRPVLTLEFCRLCGGEREQALPFAAAVEMIHSYSLIHDDLPCMDDDDYRRGKPSCHKAFGEANALLAGDGLLTLAFQTLASAPLPPDRCVRAVSCLAAYAGVFGMIGGQVVDLESEGKPVDAETLMLTHSLKTAALLKAACELGCIAAGAAEDKIEAAREYAENLGLAFQIVDDILDVEGDSKTLGKPVGSDAQSGKQTYVSLVGMEQAKADARRYSDAAMECLKIFEGHGFLLALTKKLAVRRK